MTSNSNIVVGLDLSKTDDSILRYVNYLSEKLAFEKINLLHVVPSVLAKRMRGDQFKNNLDFSISLQTGIKENLLKKVQRIFQNELDVAIEVIEAHPYLGFIEKAHELRSTMVVLGRKKETGASGITAKRMARSFEGNVLFIPEDIEPSIQRIIVPVDFSENSARALQFALNLSSKIKHSSVSCIHVVKCLLEDYQIDLNTRTELDAQFRANARVEWERFLSENGWDKELIPIEFVQGYQASIAGHLKKNIEDQNTDLIVIGAKGHSALENFIYGSVTEGLIDKCKAKPLLIVR